MNCDSPSDLVQISARGVSNYTYCPRLFYLQWVERIFVANSDTVEGAHLHRRVDEPTLVGAEDSDAPKILRSIALDDPELGLTGVLDVAEESEEGIVIVDYKKGAARRTEHGRAAKDYDSAQGITQVLLAEANGYKVQSATIYYAADRRRVPVDISDDARHRTLETIKAARQCVMDGHLPPPLIHDVRCDHCSAYPVCLPTESHRWRQGEINGDEAPSADPQPEEETTRQNRSLRPPLAEEDNREVLVVQTAGAQVGLRSGELLVSLKGEVIRKLPCKQVRAIYIFGPAQPTTQALTACLEEGVNISYFSRAGSFIGMTVSTHTTGVTARAGQYRICGSELIALPFARQCVAAKIHNQRVILLRNSDSAELSIRQLSELKRRALTASSLATLRGIEGAAAATYFGQFSSMLTT